MHHLLLLRSMMTTRMALQARRVARRLQLRPKQRPSQKLFLLGMMPSSVPRCFASSSSARIQASKLMTSTCALRPRHGR